MVVYLDLAKAHVVPPSFVFSLSLLISSANRSYIRTSDYSSHPHNELITSFDLIRRSESTFSPRIDACSSVPDVVSGHRLRGTIF